MLHQNRKITLTIDNAPSHIFEEDKLTNVKVAFLPPNMTSHIQPLDAGIIRSFKAHYRRLYILRVLDQDNEGKLDIYHIDQLEGMNLARTAWSFTTQKTVANCWRHAGILDPSQLGGGKEETNGKANEKVKEVEEAEEKLRETLESLVSSENITKKKILSVDELLDIPGEKETEQEYTIEELIEQHHLDEREAAGEHIAELDDPEPEKETPPSLSDACSMISALERLTKERGPDFEEARNLLPKLKQMLRKELNHSLHQSNLSQFGFK